MSRTPVVLGLIAAGSAFFATGVGANECERQRKSACVCQIECTYSFVRDRNAEIDASMAAYSAQRAFTLARNREIEASIAATEARRTKEFVRARNAEITASLSRVSAERAFAQARNKEIEVSVAASEAWRTKEFARARNAEINVALAAYSANRELMAFAAARNAESEKVAAIAQKARLREFARARNAEIEVALAADKAQRELVAFAAARNAESEKVAAAAEKVRMKEFAAARNAEINTASACQSYNWLTASCGAKPAQELAAARNREIQSSIITGSIRKSASPRAEAAAAACRTTESGAGAVKFSPSTSAITPASKIELSKLAALAKSCPQMQVEIHGHTDATGSPKANKRLSERRARSVADYLIAMGIDAGRLHPIGHGSTAPIASNDSSANRARNRRIEFTLTERATGPALSAIAR
jgi:outer membrane protein OmpA-like peptidoglycan-associated protein